jgi:GAF domain-containing protein
MVQQKEPNSYDKQLVALGRVLQTLREEENPDVLIDSVINYLRSEFEYELLWVGLYDRLDHRLVGKGGVTPTGDLSLLKQRFFLNPGDILEQVVIQQRPVAVADLREELRAGEWRKAAQKFNIQGTVIFPLRYRDHCYGVILMGSSAWGVSPRSDEKARFSMVFGEFAATLYKIEIDWQRQQTKHPDEPLLNLLSKMRSLTALGPRLEAVVAETHEFIQPTRTNIYWYERERRYFWRRLGNRQRTGSLGEANQPASGITIQEISSFYQALASDQIVSIGEAHSSLRADTTSRLMQQIRSRSLLAAPILFQDELLGFLAVEGNDPRIWTEGEKNFLQGAAQLIALTTPLDEMETTIAQIRLDQELTAEIARSIYDEDDWKATLKQASEQLCKRLKAERFLVLLYNKDRDEFEIAYQTYPNNRRPLTAPLEMLTETDYMLFQRSPEAIGIENLDGDLKLLVWRDRLLELGVRSLILCNTSIGHSLEGLLIVCHEAPRSWNRIERELVRVVSQQVGFILHQWQLQRQSDQQNRVNEIIQWGLKTMQQTHQIDRLEQVVLQYITQVLQVPLAVLIRWSPGQQTGQIISSPSPSDRFAVNVDIKVPVNTDLLIRWALETEEVLSLSIEAIPATTRQWLYGTSIGQILAISLRTAANHAPTGVLMVVDELGRRWAERHLFILNMLVNQLAWARRYLSLTNRLSSQCLKLQGLAWYKHRRLEETQRLVLEDLKRLSELGNPKEPLFVTRQQQILRSLNDAIAPLTRSLEEEQWQLRAYPTTISLITLLKRGLERAEKVIKQRQLWSQVHDETNLTISGDIPKIELVFYELLLIASQRSTQGMRIDIWCRQIDNRWLEILITDTGSVESRLLQDLETKRSDWLTPSILDHPPGLHLLVCQSIMKKVGGEFTFSKLEDGRNMSRLVLPLTGNLAGIKPSQS